MNRSQPSRPSALDEVTADKTATLSPALGGGKGRERGRFMEGASFRLRACMGTLNRLRRVAADVSRL